MTVLPAAGYTSDSARTTAEKKQADEDVIAAIKQLPGAGSAAEPSYTIASGSITALVGIFSVDTEGAASTDDLTNIIQTNLPEPSLIYLRAANASHVVTVKHAAGGAGQISLRNGVDFVLRTTATWLLLKRTGTTWEEIGRFYNGQPINTGAEVDVASAGTCSIGTQTGNNVRITGTTGITGFGTADAGIRIFGRFAGILTLTHNGTSLILPNAGNDITTAAGDGFIAESLGSGNWKVLDYTRADGTSLVGSANVVTATSTFGTDNRLVRSDGTGRGAQSSGITIDDSDRVFLPAGGNIILGGSVLTSGPGGQNVWVVGTAGGTGLATARFSNNSGAPQHGLYKSRGTTVDTHGVVQSGDSLGNFLFNASDGTTYVTAAQIQAFVDGTPGTSDMPGRLVLYTTPDGSTSPTEAMRLDSGQQVYLPAAVTTASAANAFIDNSTTPVNQIKRSTSSLRYKRDIEDLRPAVVDAFINAARPIWYRSIIPTDNQGWSWYGLAAEDLAKIDPRLVHWGRPEHETVYDESETLEQVTERVTIPMRSIEMRDGKAVLIETSTEIERPIFDDHPVFDAAGKPIMISVEGGDPRQAIHRAPRMKTIVRRSARTVPIGDLVPDGVQYERLTVLLLAKVQELQARISALENS